MTISQYLDRQSDSKIDRARKYLDAGQVELIGFDPASPGELRVAVGGSRPNRASIRFEPDTMEPRGAGCTCRKGTFRRPCAHILCVALLTEEGIEILEDEPAYPDAGYLPGADAIEESQQIVKARADMEALQRYVQSADFGSAEELGAFLESVQGRNIEEVLDEVRGDDPLPPEEAALRLLVDAGHIAEPARRRAVADEALAIDPNCVQAMLERALAEDTLDEQIAALERVLARARELLGEEFFAQHAGHFHELIHARPYLRVLANLAELSFDRRDYPAAQSHYRELLRLDPGDRSGARHPLMVLLVAGGDYRQVKKLYRAYPNDPFAVWQYARAIAAFRELGDTAAARKYRRRALEANPDVVLLAAGVVPYPPRTASYVLGSPEEAAWALETLEPIMDPHGGLDTWFDRGLVKYV